MRRIAKVAAIAAAVTITATGIAYASVPDAGGVIHACFSKSATRIVDNPKCKSGEKAIAWSQRGPQGPAGPAGGPEIRAAFCVVGVDSGQPAGVIERVCKFRKPLTDPCQYPIITVTPTTGGPVDSGEDGRPWPPGDYQYWTRTLENNEEACAVPLTEFKLYVRTLRTAPTGRRSYIAFAYIATVAQ
jgi:hypothetical protein